jgi:hypothetical protein
MFLKRLSTEPEASMAGRRVEFARGKVIGSANASAVKHNSRLPIVNMMSLPSSIAPFGRFFHHHFDRVRRHTRFAEIECYPLQLAIECERRVLNSKNGYL